MSEASLFDPATRARLPLWRAAWVVTRRDFIAVLFSRAFFFFLLGPLFPVFVGGLAGGIGGQVQREATATEIGVLMADGDITRLQLAYRHLRKELGPILPPMSGVEMKGAYADARPRDLLAEKGRNFAAVVSGSIDEPVLTGPTGQVQRWRGPVTLVIAEARGLEPSDFPSVKVDQVGTSAANVRSDRIKTAQGAQMLLFLLTMLLAGMVLSNLVEEKANKIIEILAAAIPMDAVFVGKLFAMLGVSFVGISVWGVSGFALFQAAGTDIGNYPAPAVGWPLFVALGVLYFAMAYLLLGSLFLSIGAMANTVREVQTLSMPVTMMQLLVFFFAAFSITHTGEPIELAAVIFPLSSPFAMLARAALVDSLWPHLLALAWQALWVGLTVKAGAGLFRKRVMKSGNAGKAPRKHWLARRTPQGAHI